jgi:hypothetical protein
MSHYPFVSSLAREVLFCYVECVNRTNPYVRILTINAMHALNPL